MVRQRLAVPQADGCQLCSSVGHVDDRIGNIALPRWPLEFLAGIRPSTRRRLRRLTNLWVEWSERSFCSVLAFLLYTQYDVPDRHRPVLTSSSSRPLSCWPLRASQFRAPRSARSEGSLVQCGLLHGSCWHGHLYLEVCWLYYNWLCKAPVSPHSGTYPLPLTR